MFFIIVKGGKTMKKQISMIALLALIFSSGCTQKVVKVDSTTYFKNQAAYTGKHTIIAADLAEVADNTDLFEGKWIEIEAPITHFEERDSPAWYLVFEKDGRKIRAYEHDFLGWVPPDAAYLARWAKHEGGEVTALGKIFKGYIELDELTYKGFIVNTSAIPT
jgi:hypothetical protein